MSSKLLAKIKKDYPDFRFKNGSKFAFRPPKTIIIGPDNNSDYLLLHELAHAILNHRDYSLDIERLKMENAAWDKAKELAQKYHLKISDDQIQAELDTYRDWLHKKSRCPACGLTRFQDIDGYHCPRCENFT